MVQARYVYRTCACLPEWHSSQFSFSVVTVTHFTTTTIRMHLSFVLGAMMMLTASVHSGPVPRPSQSCTMVHKSTPKPALRCGWHGPLDPARVSPLEPPMTVLDLASCADACRVNHECVSFGLTGDQCQLYNRSLINMNITPPGISTDTSTVFYNRGCWQQQCSTAPKSCLCTAKVTGIIRLVLAFLPSH